MAPDPLTPKVRLPFLDWTRGLAAVVMLEGHTYDSFSRPDARQHGAFLLSQFVGGLAPAVFLFLMGVTLGFLMESRARQGLSKADRLRATLRRAGYLAVLAVLFRVQLWVTAFGQSPWTDLLKVDVLNCMALMGLLLSPLCLLSLPDRTRGAALAGLFLAYGAPLASLADWSPVSPFIAHYFVPNPAFFGIFPWGAFVAFGLAYGSALKAVPETRLHNVMQWAAVTGFALVLASQTLAGLPYSLYPKVDFWLNSPALTLIKLGVIMILLSLAFLWTEVRTERWSWVQQLGRTSLVVYWIHIELVYGRWLGWLKGNLSVGQATLAAVVLILLMLLVSVAWTRRREWLPRMVPRAGPASPQTTRG